MSIYCVYLTVYLGNKLPPFYIGSSSVKKIESGYHGSVGSIRYGKIWRHEKKNNPHLFRTQIVSTHNTREEAYEKEEKLQRLLGAPQSSMYINQAYVSHPANCNGHKFSDTIRRKMSKSALKNVENGTHPLQNSDRHKARSAKQFSEGTHNFQVGGNPSAHASLVNKIRYANGKHPSLKTRKCPWCGHEGKGPNMYRYHFDKCPNREKTPSLGFRT